MDSSNNGGDGDVDTAAGDGYILALILTGMELDPAAAAAVGVDTVCGLVDIVIDPIIWISSKMNALIFQISNVRQKC